MGWHVREVIDGDQRERRIRHVTRCLSCTLTCVHCGLPAGFSLPPGHPGLGVVEHLAGAATPGLPDLALLHRFCRDNPTTETGIALRRAYLGLATELFETGRRIRCHQRRSHQRLGVRPPRPGRLEVYRKRWRVAKMRYACKACRYYTGSH
ncbi:hypothetical protein [Amycolatopsis regifaucium]|uniref:Uncharacterized protein n=1 Tax=Amycolatopsis regifaucium TaxID=546365 RepID=A0A154MTT6_9PSEU|nr:hypothetical protein [Amycolatopsis regifaucium]KZB86909.1 hypothetical protein AVL48_25055 [Amycolatopsis regifaucium]OKA09339.1 hypothetical protein ATP06_0207610 [Amycolatopsis regifaucium]SFH58792.1 hypothetical protein SAMN04489731_105138 [Amycolatopsis regifaucium]